jgi:hypothetical protein
MGSLRDSADGRRAGAVVAIVFGAFLGTLLLRVNPSVALMATAAVQFGAAAILHGVEIKS